jgi:hypothetical protein
MAKVKKELQLPGIAQAMGKLIAKNHKQESVDKKEKQKDCKLLLDASDYYPTLDDFSKAAELHKNDLRPFLLEQKIRYKKAFVYFNAWSRSQADELFMSTCRQIIDFCNIELKKEPAEAPAPAKEQREKRQPSNLTIVLILYYENRCPRIILSKLRANAAIKYNMSLSSINGKYNEIKDDFRPTGHVNSVSTYAASYEFLIELFRKTNQEAFALVNKDYNELKRKYPHFLER